MLPIALNLAAFRIVLIGTGEKLHQRENMLYDNGAEDVIVIDVEKYPEFADTSDRTFIIPQPVREAILNSRLMMVFGLSRNQNEALCALAKAHHMLVHVEDIIPYCDFYLSSFIRRGSMTIAVNTEGASPTLTKRIRAWLEKQFKPEWERYVSEIAKLRREWKKQGLGMSDLARKSDAFIEEKGWISSLRGVADDDLSEVRSPRYARDDEVV